MATAAATPTARPTPTAHIWLDERGIAWVDNTNTKVVEIVLDMLAYGSDAFEIHEQHPHLSLAQIHAALSYYYDHKAEVDALIEQWDREVEALRAKAANEPLQQKLSALKAAR